MKTVLIKKGGKEVHTSGMKFEVRVGDGPEGTYLFRVMIMPANHVIAAGVADTAQEALEAGAKYLARKCKVCGCGFLSPCKGGCSWVTEDLCSRCFPKHEARDQREREIRIRTPFHGMSIEQYLLTCLGEEGVEVAKATSKANRFGLDDVWPGKPTTNRTDIIQEFHDLYAVMELLQANGIISWQLDRARIEEKKAKISRMILYSADRGRVRP